MQLPPRVTPTLVTPLDACTVAFTVFYINFKAIISELGSQKLIDDLAFPDETDRARLGSHP